MTTPVDNQRKYQLNKTLFYLLIFMCTGPGNSFAATDPPFTLPPKAEILKLRSAKIRTSKGDIVIELFPKDAPWHVANLKYLADQGFYQNIRINKYRRNYVIQMGAPGSDISGGPGYTLPPEFNEHKHITGAISMVRRPNELDTEHTRRSHGSQFRILMQPNRVMDGQFVVFGRVASGLEVVKKLRLNDVIKNVIVYVREPGLA